MAALAGSVALVTGGASGIGRALCRALAAEGCAVLVIADVDAPGAARAAAELARAGLHVEVAALDVTDGAAVDALVQRTCERHGRLDWMINAAGIGIWGEASALPLAHWRRVIDVDFWGVVHGTRAALAVMAPRGSGRIVNIASLAGLVAAPSVVPYAAAKHAVVGLSTSWWPEAAEHGIAIHVACPGPVRTAFHASLLRTGGSGAGAGAGGPRPQPVGMDADAAARAILRGVARGRHVIVFPGRARWLWALQRFWPARIAARGRATARRLRAAAARAPQAQG